MTPEAKHELRQIKRQLHKIKNNAAMRTIWRYLNDDPTELHVVSDGISGDVVSYCLTRCNAKHVLGGVVEGKYLWTSSFCMEDGQCVFVAVFVDKCLALVWDMNDARFPDFFKSLPESARQSHRPFMERNIPERVEWFYSMDGEQP